MASGSALLGWQDVAAEQVKSWRQTFDASAEGIDLTAACPVCKARSLHRWFNVHRARASVSDGRAWQGSGSQWQWCSSCRSYEHASGLVPDWWSAPFEIPLESLRHDPEEIELMRLRAS
jgi:hypothetical protein